MELEQAIELWWHYEEIAMHFNELIIQYRLQILGGTGGLLALFSFLVNSTTDDHKKRIRIRPYISLVFLVIFSAAAVLDVYYYSKLLSGAVEVIVDLESKHPELNMSTHIKSKFGADGATGLIKGVYFIVWTPLAFFTLKFWKDYLELKKEDG